LDVELIIDRLLQHYEINTISELAVRLNSSQSTISGWKSRNSIGAIVDKLNEIDPKLLSLVFSNPINTQNLENNSGFNTQIDNSSGTKSISKDNITNDKDLIDIFNKIVVVIGDNESKKEAFIKHTKSWLIDNI
jgi:hypothetical protein